MDKVRWTKCLGLAMLLFIILGFATCTVQSYLVEKGSRGAGLGQRTIDYLDRQSR